MEEESKVYDDPGLNFVAMTATEEQFLQWIANVIVSEADDQTKLLAIASVVLMRGRYV